MKSRFQLSWKSNSEAGHPTECWRRVLLQHQSGWWGQVGSLMWVACWAVNKLNLPNFTSTWSIMKSTRRLIASFSDYLPLFSATLPTCSAMSPTSWGHAVTRWDFSAAGTTWICPTRTNVAVGKETNWWWGKKCKFMAEENYKFGIKLEITYEFLDIVGPAKLARLSKERREIRKVWVWPSQPTRRNPELELSALRSA